MAEDVSYVSVSHFTSEALNILSRLNARRLFPSYGTSKLPRDWRGLANLTGITAQDAENKHENMVQWILDTWIRTDERTAVVHQLFRHLETMDRYDIRDDLQELAAKNRLVDRERKWPVENRVVAYMPAASGDELLTMDDVDQGAPVEYDALVLYAADDQEFVDDMISNMTEIGFKLFTKHSLRPGVMPYGPMTELISSRCRHTILVYSPAFFNSLDDRFYTDYVHARNIGVMTDGPVTELISSRCRHTILVYSPAFFNSLDDRFYTDYVHARNIEKKHTLIPCLYQPCELPPQFRYYFALYVKSTAYNFWDRLARVVDAGRTPRLIAPNPTNSVRIQEVTSGSQLKITNGGQRAITNGQISNGQVPNGQFPKSPAPAPQHTTTTLALPDVASSTLSLSLSLSSLDSRRETASLNDLSVKKKKSGFLKKLLKFPRNNKKSKEALLASK